MKGTVHVNQAKIGNEKLEVAFHVPKSQGNGKKFFLKAPKELKISASLD